MKGYQQGSIQARKLRTGGFTFRLFWRTRSSNGAWTKESKTLPKGTTRKEAQAELRRILVEAKADEAKPSSPKVTFSALATVHLKAYLDKQNVRRSTRDGYDSVLKRWILPFFETLSLESITPATISEFMETLREGKLSGKSQKNIYCLLNFLFELARTFDFIQASPIRPLLHRPSVVRKEKPTLPLDKAKAFFQAIPSDYKPVIALLILTGMRQGEMLGLRWQDIDFKSKLIHKRNVVYRGRIIEGLKETSRQAGKLRRHVVGMSETLRAILETHRAASLHTKAEDFVFCREDGRPLDPDHIRRSVLYPALRAAKIPLERHGSGLHLLRHTCISEVSKRLGIKAAQDVAGHADIQVTANIYTHVDAETKLAAASVLGTSFDFVS